MFLLSLFAEVELVGARVFAREWRLMAMSAFRADRSSTCIAAERESHIVDF